MKQAVTLNIKLGKIMEHSLVDRLFTLLDEQLVTSEQVITMFLKYLSEDELAEMLDMNELSERFE
jgi:hypothetical protein